MTTPHLTRIKAQSMANIKRRAGRLPQPTERQIQCSIVQWCKAQRILCFSVPNGSKRDLKQAAAMKADGMLAGAPDLAILLPNRKLLWVEVKSHTGSLEPSQKAVHALMDTLGHAVHVVRTLAEVQLLVIGERS